MHHAPCTTRTTAPTLEEITPHQLEDLQNSTTSTHSIDLLTYRRHNLWQFFLYFLVVFFFFQIWEIKTSVKSNFNCFFLQAKQGMKVSFSFSFFLAFLKLKFHLTETE